MGSWFVLGRLACSTSIYVVFGELGETGPPVFSRDEFIGFSMARVADCRVVRYILRRSRQRALSFGT